MASKKPIIASNVDGVPNIIKDGFNGLLFESENVDDLAKKLTFLLSNKTYRDKLANNGYNYVKNYLSEERYIENYKKMVDSIFISR
ncbi:MAG: glycosyltransferase [Promethearchaeota archaeon]